MFDVLVWNACALHMTFGSVETHCCDCDAYHAPAMPTVALSIRWFTHTRSVLACEPDTAA